MPTGPHSIFDGYTLTLFDADGVVVGSWQAISGARGYQKPSDQNLVNVGPIPEGNYAFSVEQIQPLDSIDQFAGLLGRGAWPGSVNAGWQLKIN